MEDIYDHFMTEDDKTKTEQQMVESGSSPANMDNLPNGVIVKMSPDGIGVFGSSWLDIGVYYGPYIGQVTDLPIGRLKTIRSVKCDIISDWC